MLLSEILKEVGLKKKEREGSIAIRKGSEEGYMEGRGHFIFGL